VRGDIIHVRGGDRVAADIRIVHTSGLLIDNSIITKDSDPVPKSADYTNANPLETNNLLLCGTSVSRGDEYRRIAAQHLSLRLPMAQRLESSLKRLNIRCSAKCPTPLRVSVAEFCSISGHIIRPLRLGSETNHLRTNHSKDLSCTHCSWPCIGRDFLHRPLFDRLLLVVRCSNHDFSLYRLYSGNSSCHHSCKDRLLLLNVRLQSCFNSAMFDPHCTKNGNTKLFGQSHRCFVRSGMYNDSVRGQICVDHE
jgi:hypothetical protein